MTIKEIHEEVFKFLLNKREADPSLRYNLRYQKGEKLNVKHYWFHGSDVGNNLYITFWNAWTTVFPTINFVINQDGTASLHIDERRGGITAKIWQELESILSLKRGFDKEGHQKDYWAKSYPNKPFLENLDDFIKKERPFINSYLELKNRPDDYPAFPEYEFRRNFEKIENIRKGIKDIAFDDFLSKKLTVNCLQLSHINAFDSLNLSFDKQVTCFVGGNGSGKTTILRGISLALTGSKGFKFDDLKLLAIKEAKKDRIYQPEGIIDIFYKFNKNKNTNTVKFRSIDNGREPELVNKDKGNSLRDKTEEKLLQALIVGFSQQMQTENPLNTNGGYSPKVSDIEFLILNKPDNRFHEFATWLKKVITADDKQDRNNNLIIVHEIFNILNDITGDNIELTSETDTFIKTRNNPEGIPIDLLSQGYRNVFAWLGFFIKRLWEYGETLPFDVPSFKELPAVCLIDEIDTYLHPDWQYTILSALVEHFKNVQFFITSHSPFVLTSVPSDKIAIFELTTQSGQVFAREKNINLYGADANRATLSISSERKEEIQKSFKDLDAFLDNNELEDAQSILENQLKDIDSDLDLGILRAKRAIRTKQLLQKAKQEGKK